MLGRRALRIPALLLAFLLLATVTMPGPPPPPREAGTARLFARAVALDEHDPARRRVGALVFLRGWELSSDDQSFGGLSAMQIEGGRAVAVGDAGTLFEFDLPRHPGATALTIVPLSAGGGAAKSGRDTESLTLHGGRAWIGFEGLNAVARYRRDGWAAETAARPAAMRGWRSNAGAEAMVRLPDGRFLVFAEGRRGEETSPVLLFAGDPAVPGTGAEALRYRRSEGFRVTDAALLPDGRLLILSRRLSLLSGVRARLAVADLPALQSGAVIEGVDIAELAAPLAVDNMEALSVASEGGRTIIRIASDDNFMAIQRTLLLEFALVEQPSMRRGPGSRVEQAQ